MLQVLANRTYRYLFAAQAISLIGTGLTTVALGLLAFDLAGDRAGMVLGTALVLKMVAYVGFSPIAGALASRFDRTRMLVTLDLVRAGFVLGLPFVTEIWQIYVLVFAFQLMSAAFTPTFQATIPNILQNEEDYTRALSLSRLAYDLEAILSPLLAGIMMLVISFELLFLGTTLGFLLSAALVLLAGVPTTELTTNDEPFAKRIVRGIQIYLATPRLQGLLCLSFAVSAVGSMIIVNSVVYVREVLGADEHAYALVLMAVGVGSITAALCVPRLTARFGARLVMLTGAAMLAIIPIAVLAADDLPRTLVIWGGLGFAMSLVGTPGGLLLRRSAHEQDRAAIFAAQFSLSHACWLVTYPLAGWLGVSVGIPSGFMIMATLAALGCLGALWRWPPGYSEDIAITHHHDRLDHEHLHVHDAHHQHPHEGWEGPEPHRHPHRHRAVTHSHVFVIDDHHPIWPR
ncbi:MAG: MFS transporter [Pseudomonadota bacterium]